jgi:hemerythrin-like domain-containing protein
MREHGVLRRLLLVYDDVLRRLASGASFPTQPVVQSAEIVRHFIEDYHERLEEQFVFPAFRQAGSRWKRLAALVDVLQAQHVAGRRLTDIVLAQARSARSSVDLRGAARMTLASGIQRFVRMYSPHAAREDTDLFPALREVVPAREYAEMGEKFEDQEQALLGARGFAGAVQQVAAIEESLGLYDLKQYTPL